MPKDKENIEDKIFKLPKQVDYEIIVKLADLLEDGVILHDEQRRIFMANKAIEKITGRKRTDIIGKDCHEAFPPDGVCGYSCAYKKTAVDYPVFRDNELVFISKDGQEKKVRIKSCATAIEGINHSVMVVVRDISQIDELLFRQGYDDNFHGMIGACASMKRIFQMLKSAGPSPYPALISGPSGTGKELAARAIHTESRRSHGPFVPVNCGALPENIIESELFGHVRGSFTGAIRDKKGRFELARGGTLFLDEVGELSPKSQVKLLRVLQDNIFERVGDEKSMKADVRIVSATNRSLKQLVKSGDFREDLYYRLCVIPVQLPSLKDRKKDIPLILQHILKVVSKEKGTKIKGIADSAIKAILHYDWPGNVRELINTIQFASVQCGDENILLSHLPFEVRMNENLPDAGLALTETDNDGNLDIISGKKRKVLTKETVKESIENTGGNKAKACKLLGVSRATLYRFLSENSIGDD